MIDPYHYPDTGGFTFPERRERVKMPPLDPKPQTATQKGNTAMPKFPPFEKPYPKSFNARVRYADSVISAGREPDRAFDCCFECGAGDKVVAALQERAKSNPRLADGLTKYVSVDIRTSAPTLVQTDLFNA